MFSTDSFAQIKVTLYAIQTFTSSEEKAAMWNTHYVLPANAVQTDNESYVVQDELAIV